MKRIEKKKINKQFNQKNEGKNVRHTEEQRKEKKY